MADGTKKMINRIESRVPDALEVVGYFVETEAIVRVPVKTGNLRGSINHKVIVEDDAVRIGTPVEYAPYVEFGTSKQSAQPYLRPAVLENKKRIDKLFKRLLEV